MFGRLGHRHIRPRETLSVWYRGAGRPFHVHFRCTPLRPLTRAALDPFPEALGHGAPRTFTLRLDYTQ